MDASIDRAGLGTRLRFAGFLFVFLFFTGLSPVNSQQERMPPAYGIVYAEVEGRWRDLENRRPDYVSQPPVRGFSRDFLAFSGSRSPIRFSDEDRLSFLVSYRIDASDPYGVNVQQLDPLGFELHRLEIHPKQRRLVLRETNLYRETQSSGILLKAIPLPDNMLRLESGESLGPGEYAVVYQPRVGGVQAFCFAIEERRTRR